MSTHIHEITHLANVARSEGAEVDLRYDERGYVDHITVRGLEGLPDMSSSPLAVVEELRRVIGRKANAPEVTYTDDGIPTYRYTKDQLMAYADVKSMLQQKAYRRDIPPQSLLMSQSPSTIDELPESHEDYWQTRYWLTDKYGEIHECTEQSFNDAKMLVAEPEKSDNGPTAAP